MFHFSFFLSYYSLLKNELLNVLFFAGTSGPGPKVVRHDFNVPEHSDRNTDHRNVAISGTMVKSTTTFHHFMLFILNSRQETYI